MSFEPRVCKFNGSSGEYSHHKYNTAHAHSPCLLPALRPALMDDPVADIEGVVRQLTQTPPSVQRSAIITYFTPDAQFTHPFCRTGSFDGSRFLIRAIYRWYKIMSPSIDLTVNSIGLGTIQILGAKLTS